MTVLDRTRLTDKVTKKGRSDTSFFVLRLLLGSICEKGAYRENGQAHPDMLQGEVAFRARQKGQGIKSGQ